MFSLTLRKAPPAVPVQGDFQAELVALCQFGNPCLRFWKHTFDDTVGWHCHVDMRTNGKGCTFEVASDRYCKTPIDAVRQCQERINAAIDLQK